MFKQIIYTMKSHLPDGKAEQFYDFMIEPTDEAYSNWLPEHHQYHIVKRGKNSPVGDLVFFDQHISPNFRLKSYAIVRVAGRPCEITVQVLKFGMRVPVFVSLYFEDTLNGLVLTEEVRAGYRGVGAIFNPFFRLVLTKRKLSALTKHHNKEWKELERILIAT
ncbi:MAG: hypothetical protein FWD02_01460 [Bacteroidales bacterium]|nr:hypothetical protein [Bacteroidales bacterium]